jgi:hypothetical protein
MAKQQFILPLKVIVAKSLHLNILVQNLILLVVFLLMIMIQAQCFMLRILFISQ